MTMRRQSNSRISSATEKLSGSRKGSVESIAGTGINVVRQRGSKLNAVQPSNRKLNKSITAPSTIAVDKRDNEPESIIGEGVDIRGTLEFERLLRIDGCFEGLLVSHGDLIIGPTGSLIGNLKGIQNLVIDGGKIVGNVSVQRIVMIGKASIEGDITCKSLKAGTEAILLGSVNIHLRTPELIDIYGNIITHPIQVILKLSYDKHRAFIDYNSPTTSHYLLIYSD
jgi:cytoskeletal protein CcmA (bactofilin family)